MRMGYHGVIESDLYTVAHKRVRGSPPQCRGLILSHPGSLLIHLLAMNAGVEGCNGLEAGCVHCNKFASQ